MDRNRKIWPKIKRKKVNRNRPSDDPDVWTGRKELRISIINVLKLLKDKMIKLCEKQEFSRETETLKDGDPVTWLETLFSYIKENTSYRKFKIQTEEKPLI